MLYPVRASGKAQKSYINLGSAIKCFSKVMGNVWEGTPQSHVVLRGKGCSQKKIIHAQICNVQAF